MSAAASPLLAHGPEPRYVRPLEWRAPGVAAVYGLGRGLGLRGKGTARVEEVAGRRCVVGAVLGFDVDDAFAFDLDETVTLILEVDARSTSRLVVGYDRNGLAEDRQIAEVVPDPQGPWGRVVLPLERARFAGRGPLDTDFALGSPELWGTVTVCGVALERSAAGGPESTAPEATPGRLVLTLTNAVTGRPTAARVGLYDATGRTPLPGEGAVPVRFFTDPVRHVVVRPWAFWPEENHHAFYADGEYAAELPPGSYRLVAMKGLEYRLGRASFTVAAGETARVRLPLRRWSDLPERGWYSGDVHLHVPRHPGEEPAILAQVAAEDLHVANLLEMGNVRTTYFRHPAWGEAGQARRGSRVLVPGQEDPRTGHRGHTIALNLERPVRDLSRYFLYHRAFEAVHRQGGLAGYAHLSYGWFGVLRGLALDVPFGLVDFLEVLQAGNCDTDAWYAFLDLGFPLVPAAGSDFPYMDLPGTVRSYVQVDGDFSAQGWFDGLAAGRTFVTNGPLLELTVNGRGMGSRLAVEAGETLRVLAAAAVNPDFEPLERLELVVHGRVVASVQAPAGGARTLRLEHELTAGDGLWLAVRALGVAGEELPPAVAHSAPVYVSVAGRPFWQPERVPEIVARQRRLLAELLESPVDPREDLEFWQTAEVLQRRWHEQKPWLRRRAAEANALYDALLARLQAPAGGGPEALEIQPAPPPGEGHRP